MSEIPPINDINQYGLPRHDKIRKKGTARSTSFGSDKISKTSELEFIEAQVEKLLSMPDIRPEMLQLGKKLAKSKDFPSGENLEKLAEALISPIDDLLEEFGLEEFGVT